MEANTPAVPDKDRFYVLVAGEVCLGPSSFTAASAKYEGLCVAHWEQQLTHPDPPTRLLAARGLYRHNPDHRVAGELLARQGDARDRAAVVSMRPPAGFASRKEP